MIQSQLVYDILDLLLDEDENEIKARQQLKNMKQTLILAICIILPFAIFEIYRNAEYSKKDKLYVLFEHSSYHIGVRGTSELHATYTYNGHHYEISNYASSGSLDRANKGEKFLIELLKEDPSVGIVLCDYIIPDTMIIFHKSTIWEEVPIDLKEKD